MVARGLALCALAVFAACAARTELGAPEPEPDASVEDATVDVSVDVIAVADAQANDALTEAQAALFCVAPPSVDAGAFKLCKRTLDVGSIAPSKVTCFVDTAVKSGDVGLLEYDCTESSHAAVAHFDGGVFTGTIDGSAVALCTGSQFVFRDGCTWASAQRIIGDLDSGVLAFTYDEGVISENKNGNCASACTAGGPVDVAP